MSAPTTSSDDREQPPRARPRSCRSTATAPVRHPERARDVVPASAIEPRAHHMVEKAKAALPLLPGRRHPDQEPVRVEADQLSGRRPAHRLKARPFASTISAHGRGAYAQGRSGIAALAFFNHVMRSWLLWARTGTTSRARSDANWLQWRCFLHDLGFARGGAPDLAFEVVGGTSAAPLSLRIDMGERRARQFGTRSRSTPTRRLRQHKGHDVACCQKASRVNYGDLGFQKPE